jgi:hypothetical protein
MVDGRVVLHVGAPKTGSTYLQGVLWNNRSALVSAGVEMLGAAQAQHYRAGKDIRSIPFDPADPGVDWSGAWVRMTHRALASTSPTVVVSDEHLAALTSAQVEQAVTSLAPRDVHVVYVTRDLAGLLPSEWQEYVKHGSVLDYDEWVRRTFARPDQRPGRWFWSVHDAAAVARRWMCAVPAGRVHVIAMPGPEAPREELWNRFASVLGVDPRVVVDHDVPANPSLGPVAVEVLRRVNQVLPADLPPWHRTGLVRDVLANVVLNPLGDRGRPGLPPGMAADVLARARAIRAELLELGCDIVGELPAVPASIDASAGSRAPDPAAVADVAVEALAGLVTQMARMRDDRPVAERHINQDHARQAAIQARRGPVARRVEAARRRIVAAEDTHPALGGVLERYRRIRRRSR